METTRRGTMRTTVHLIATTMFIVMVYSTLLSATYAADEKRCDILRRCTPTICNIEKCQVWHKKDHIKSAFCKKTSFEDLCCCEVHTTTPSPPSPSPSARAGKHPPPRSP